MNSKISCAVAAILGSATCATAIAADTRTDQEGLEEVTVTAQRRSENIQDVPISIQALTAQTLQQLNVSTFDDYVKYLPNVSAASNGPGQNELFMRGLSSGSQVAQGSGSTATWPNVAIYLDNQSGQLPNRNLDIYAADLDRIEVLEGPQGTLFGAGAQAGVIRYITNQPKLNVTEGSLKAGYGVTAHGDPNTDFTAVLNLPLIADTLAVRGVLFSDRRGGYIDNVQGTFTRKNTDLGIGYAYLPANAAGSCPNNLPNNGFCVPPGSPVLNNYDQVARAINPVTYQGVRVEGLYKISDEWDVLITQSYQSMDAEGVFYQQPRSSDGVPLNPLEVTLFNPARNKDKFESTAWTANGKFGNLKAVYTGGYLVRNVDAVGDYTNYARGVYADYYQCYGPGAAPSQDPKSLPSTCFSASSPWRETERNTHQQHEFRLSTPDEWRLRAIAGAFWEDNKLFDNTSWMYKNQPPCTSNAVPGVAGNGNTGCLSNTGTFSGSTVGSPGIQGDHTAFHQDQVRDVKQTAAFASVDFDLIPKTLTITGGTRYFKFDSSMKGSVLSSFNCFQAGVSPTGCHPTYPDIIPWYSYNLDALNLRDTESGFRSRGNLTWHVTPDVMVYYTYSQGFRPGGFNQPGAAGRALSGPAPSGVVQYFIPRTFHSDDLTNNELGWKTEFFDHRLQWNGAIYRETWKNAQVVFFDPGVVGNVTFDTNGQNFLIKGIETSLVARPVPGLTLQGAASWNHSEQTNSPALINNNNGQVAGIAASPNYGKPITYACNPLGVCADVVNPYGPKGSPSANSPPIQFNLRARYDWTVGGYNPFIQIGAVHTGHSFTQAGANPTFSLGGNVSTSRGRFEVPAYTTYDASAGVTKDAWVLTVYGENLGNSNASTFITTAQFIVARTPLRPRVLGAAINYKF